MNLYRNKENEQLYIVEHLVHDMKHLNGNAFRGIYPCPFNHIIQLKPYTYDQCEINGETYDPDEYVEQNFGLVTEI